MSIFCPGVVATRIWDARRSRQDRYGGASRMPAEFAERAEKAMVANGMTAELCAQLAIEGVERREFLIITDPRIRQITVPRQQAINAALDACEAASRSIPLQPASATPPPRESNHWRRVSADSSRFITTNFPSGAHPRCNRPHAPRWP